MVSFAVVPSPDQLMYRGEQSEREEALKQDKFLLIGIDFSRL